MSKLSKEHLSKINPKVNSLGEHFESALKKTGLSDFRISHFTLEPKLDPDHPCTDGYHLAWVPIGNGKYVQKCVPD